ESVMDRDGAHRPAEFVVALIRRAIFLRSAEMPDGPRVGIRLGLGRADIGIGYEFGGDVVALAGRVDAPQVPDALEVFRILAGADVDLAVVHDRRGDEIALGAFAAELVNRILRIGVELPDHLAGLRFEPIEPTVAAGKDHGRDAA